jgi:exodeoxyribonuclease VII large subunit
VSVRHRIETADAALATGALRLRRQASRPVSQAERRVAALEAVMRAHEPGRTLARGWSVTRRTDGSLVRRPDQVAPGDALVTTTAGGAIDSTVVGHDASAEADSREGRA